MPKRRRPLNARLPTERDQKWTVEEWTSILAWLDYSLIPRRRKIAFEDTIQGHFQSKWPDRETSQPRIFRKLEWIWDNKAPDGPNGKHLWKQILREGSKCLNMVSFWPDERAAFSHARAELGLSTLAEVEDGEPRELTDAENSKVMEKKQPIMLNSNITMDENSVSGLKRKAQDDLLDGESAKEYCNYDKGLSNSLTVENGQSNSQLQSEVAELSQKIKDQENKITIITQQLPHLSRQIAECAEDLKKYISLQKSAAKRDSLTHESTITNLEEQIDTLRKQRDLYCKLVAPDLPVVITISEIADKMAEIQYQIKKVFDGDNTGISFPKYGPLDDALMELIQYCGISRNKHELETNVELQEAIKLAGEWSVLRAITAAAMCSWVFESDFPNFDKEQSSLLEIYRRKLASQTDGSIFVRNLDFDSYNALIDEDHTRKYIVELEAKTLALRLENTLVKSGRFPGDYWGRKRTDKLVAIFRLCLTLKAKTVITGKTYMLDMVPSGVTVTNNMECEGNNGAPVEQEQLPATSRVQLCLFPRIDRRIPSESMLADFGQSTSALVQPRNFVRRDGNVKPDSFLPPPIKKAVVLCA